MLFVAGPLQGDCGFEVASVAIGNQVENVCTFSSLAGRAFFSSLASAAVRARKILAKSCEGGSHRAGVPIPLRGCRIGEASHPGPPHTSSQQPSHWVAKLRRDRPTCTSLANSQWLRPGAQTKRRECSRAFPRAETLSDTLSADTPFASPRGSLAHGGAPTAPDEATPEFTLVDEPDTRRATAKSCRVPETLGCTSRCCVPQRGA